MKFDELKCGCLFTVPSDVTRSILRKQWSINMWNRGMNATFVVGMLKGEHTWVDENIEVRPLAEQVKTKEKRQHG